MYFFSPVRGRYLVMYSYTDTIYIICEFEIYETVPEFPGKFYVPNLFTWLSVDGDRIKLFLSSLLQMICI